MKKNNLKRTLALATSAFALSAAFVGCTDYSEFSESDFKQEAKLQEYYDNFVKEFGEPDPNHTWGFGMTPEMAHAILGENNISTRGAGDDPYAQPGAINTNVNQWTENNPNSLKNVVHVPGWPAEDGRFYTRTGTYNTNGTYDRYDKESEASGNVMGDVTEYEIQWVSRKMRTTTYTDLKDKHSALLHMSEFFIQQVSTDYDYNSDGTVHAYGTGQTQYEMDKLDFQSITGAWTHINNFNAYSNLAPQTHVGENSARNIMYVMSSGTEDFEYHPSTSTEDTFKKYVLVEFSWVEPLNPDWTKVTNGTYELDYVLDNPAVLDPEGKTFKRTGYYLCFDYQASKHTGGADNWDYLGDDIYSNWILKLTPGKFKSMGRWPKRLMCEDLGNTKDFDFNDAVFDLVFQANTTDPGWFDCVITVQAAGGTMPIWIGADPRGWADSDKTEIHNLLGGNDSKTPVNVIKGGAKSIPASYRVKHLFSTSEATTTFTTDSKGNIVVDQYPLPSATLQTQMAAAAFLLEIYIKNPNLGWQAVSGEAIFKSLRNGESPTYTDGYNDGNLSNNAAPQLFNCSVDAKWTYEGTHIKDAYEHFIDWVHDEQCDYRLRWDENEYYARMIDPSTNKPTVSLVSNEGKNWDGSWDWGLKTSNAWGSAWITKSNCWGGTGSE